MNKKTLIYAIVLIIVVIVVVLVFGGQKNKESDKIIKVGVIAPMSGFMAEFGEATRNGIVLAQKDSENKNNVKFIFEDSSYDPKKAISAYEKLVLIDGVDVVIDWGSATTEAETSVAKKYSNIPLISISSMVSAPSKSKNIIRFFEKPDAFAEKTWEHLRKMNLKKIAVLKTQNQWLNSVYDKMVEQTKDGERVDLIDDVSSFGEMDFRTSIAKIKSSDVKYDAVGVFLGSGQIGQFYKQSRSLGLNIKTFGTDFFESQSDINVAGVNMNGSFYAQYDVSKIFKDDYNNQYKNLSQIVYAGLSYDLAKYLMDGKNINSGQDVLRGLEKFDNHKGVIGSYSFKNSTSDSDRYMEIPLHIKEVRDLKIDTLY